MKKSAVILFSILLLFSCNKTKKTQTENTIIKEVPPMQIEQKETLSIPEFIPSYNKSIALKDNGNKTFSDKTSAQAVKEIICGWNLGNTLDAYASNALDSEISWGQPMTTKKMIDGLAASKIKTIRIPISWSKHIIDSNYTIDPKWMARVKEIVDWAISNDMYVIINCHHDNYLENGKVEYGQGYYPNTENFDESIKFLQNLWSQISLAFNNGYDEHLIFELLNEPRLAGTKYEWNIDEWATECRDALNCLNLYNQSMLDVIRNSDGNNKKRFVICTSLAAAPIALLSSKYIIPNDIEKDRLIISVHMYSPYGFAMENPGKTEFTDDMKKELDYNFNALNKKFVLNGYPVIVTEYGATNKNNLQQRVNWFTYFITAAKQYNIPCILWDNGSYVIENNDFSEKYGYYNRIKQTWYFPEIHEAIINAAY